MSTLRVDKITPYLSASVTIEGNVVQANAATTGSNIFVGNQNIQGTITASIQQGFALVGGVGNVSTLVPTSSFGGALPSGVVSGSAQISLLGFATTGSNTFNGNQIVNGSSTQTLASPGTDAVVDFIKITNATPVNKPYNQTNFALQNLPSFGPDYEDVFVIESFDSAGYNYGSEFGLNGLGAMINVTPSGSAFGVNTGILRIKDTENQKSVAVLDASVVELGAGVSTTENIKIGNTSLPVTSIRSTAVQITGSVSLSSTLQLAQQNPLPTGAVGQLAVSASNLYYHNGSGWTQIN